MKKIILFIIVLIAFFTIAQSSFFGSNNEFIKQVEGKEFIGKTHYGFFNLKFKNEKKLNINDAIYDIKIEKDNHLTLKLDGKEVEKSYVSSYKDEVILFEVYSAFGKKYKKRQVLYINKNKSIKPKICNGDVLTTEEAFRYLKKKNGDIYCYLLNRNTISYYVDKIKFQKIFKILKGKWIDKRNDDKLEFFENGTWALNGDKQSIYTEHLEDYIKLEYKNKISYSLFSKPHLDKKTKCITMEFKKRENPTKTDSLTLCRP